MSNALQRQLQILRILPRAPARKSIAQIREHLETAGFAVTTRTLQRDLNSLSATFALQSDDAKAGTAQGWSWARNAKTLDIPSMDANEALTLRMVERFLPQLMPPVLRDYLEPFFERARTVLEQDRQPRSRRWLDSVRVIPRELPLLPPTTDRKAADTVYQAYLDGRRFTARYRGARKDDAKEYEVNPLGLVARGNLIYLVCTLFDYTDIRQLALHRVRSATLLDKPATRPRGFDIDRYIAEGHFQYLTGETIKLTARFQKDAAAHLAETALSKDQTLTPNGDGTVTVTATVKESDQLEWWLLAFGEYVTVLGPRTLRDRLAERSARLADNYKE